jgi:hypothetical protein
MKKDKKPRRLRDWLLDIRDALNNIKSVSRICIR